MRFLSTCAKVCLLRSECDSSSGLLNSSLALIYLGPSGLRCRRVCKQLLLQGSGSILANSNVGHLHVEPRAHRANRTELPVIKRAHKFRSSSRILTAAPMSRDQARFSAQVREPLHRQGQRRRHRLELDGTHT